MYSPAGGRLDGCFRLQKSAFVVRLRAYLSDEPVTPLTSHAVYDTKYHLVWAPKYRKWILRGDVRERARELFVEIAGRHDIEIDTMEVASDHVHLFVSFPMTTWNYDLLLEHYSEHVGVLSGGLFAKQITDPIFEATEMEGDLEVSQARSTPSTSTITSRSISRRATSSRRTSRCRSSSSTCRTRRSAPTRGAPRGRSSRSTT